VDQVFAAWPEAARAVLRGEAGEAVSTLADGAGTMRDYSLRSFPLSGRSDNFVAVIRDDTSLRRAERELKALSDELERKVAERSQELELESVRRLEAQENLAALNLELGRTQREIMFTLSELVENRGDESARHVARVSEYARIFGRAVGLSKDAVDLLADASAMHDIGKIGVPDSILKKPGSLTLEETAIMRSHTRIGWEILRKSDRELIRLAAVIALEHHERWDGQGYPEAKAGTAISIEARIVAICDVFDSLAAVTTYRRGWNLSEILQFFRKEKGQRFDPDLVGILFVELNALNEVSHRLPDLDAGWAFLDEVDR
jgi:putative two-component system response regulator